MLRKYVWYSGCERRTRTVELSCMHTCNGKSQVSERTVTSGRVVLCRARSCAGVRGCSRARVRRRERSVQLFHFSIQQRPGSKMDS
jgi:hypothetical protein